HKYSTKFPDCYFRALVSLSLLWIISPSRCLQRLVVSSSWTSSKFNTSTIITPSTVVVIIFECSLQLLSRSPFILVPCRYLLGLLQGTLESHILKLMFRVLCFSSSSRPSELLLRACSN